MKKGFYFIVTGAEDRDGNHYNKPTLSEGSFENYGRLFIHRSTDYTNNPHKWKVSHVESGACLCANNTLKEARRKARGLKDFSIFELKTIDELKQAINHNPDYAEEIEQIQLLR